MKLVVVLAYTKKMVPVWQIIDVNDSNKVVRHYSNRLDALNGLDKLKETK